MTHPHAHNETYQITLVLVLSHVSRCTDYLVFGTQRFQVSISTLGIDTTRI